MTSLKRYSDWIKKQDLPTCSRIRIIIIDTEKFPVIIKWLIC